MTQSQQGPIAPTTQHIMIPVAATAKVAGTMGPSPRPSILRKRDNEGGLVLAAAAAAASSSPSTGGGAASGSNSMVVVQTTTSSNTGGGGVMNSLNHNLVATSSSSFSSSTTSGQPHQQQQQHIVKGVKNLVPILHAIGSGSGGGVNSTGGGIGGGMGGSSGLNMLSSATSAKMEIIAKERSSGLYVSPPAGSPSDGSTTVSANSSPGVDKQQLQQHLQNQQDNELNSTALSLKLQSELKKVRGKELKEGGGGAAAGRRSREPSPRKKIKKQ